MEVKRFRALLLEIFKTLKDLNPSYMKEIFFLNDRASRRPNNLSVQSCNTTRYGDKSLRVLGPSLWNALPEDIKSETNYNSFSNHINKWFGSLCKCNLCIFAK